MKKYILITSSIITAILCLFCSCAHPWMLEKSPLNQPNTKWLSEDETIEFLVGEDYMATGTMRVNGKDVEFCIFSDRRAGLLLYPISVLDDDITHQNDRYEEWLCRYKANEFVATVWKTTFFEEKQKIKFYRVEA